MYPIDKPRDSKGDAMASDYPRNNTNDLTNALRNYGETKGIDRYNRSKTRRRPSPALTMKARRCRSK